MQFGFVPELETADTNLQTVTGEILAKHKDLHICRFGENVLLNQIISLL